MGLNFGRVINPATNNFETENSFFQSYGLSSGVALFQGGAITNSIKQSNLDLKASMEDIEQAKNDLGLQVALAYLNVLFADENLVNARASMALTQAQLDQIDKFIAAGVRPEAARFDIVAQLALDEQNIVLFQNNYEINLLSLKNFLRLEPNYPMQIEKPALDLNTLEPYETYTFESVYNAALGTQPQLRAQQLRIESSQLGEKIAEASLYPSLTVGASVGTNYSDLAQRALGFETLRVPVPGVFINNEEVAYEIEQEVPTGIERTPYGTQLDNNVGYGFSAQLSVPLYNNYRSKAGVERAKLNTLQEQNNDEQLRQTLSANIENALASARAARESLDASERSLEAATIAYTHAQRRFDLGALNTFDLINARNRLESAQINVTIAKYDYLFRAKVIEFYLGRGLTLN